MKKFICLMLSILLVFGMAGCGKTTEESQDNPNGTNAGIPVEVTLASAGEMQEYYTVSGTAFPIREATIIAKTPGEIEFLNVSLGDKVTQGTLLCSLDKSDVLQTIQALNAQIAQADASIETAQINADRAQGSGYEQTLMQAETALTQAQSAMDQAKINLDLQTTTYENMKILYEKGNISRVNFESVEAQYQAALSSYEAAKSAYENALRSVELAKQTAEDNITAADSGVTGAQAGKNVLLTQLATAQNTLAEMDITAPIDGVIVMENAKIGEMATGALYQIADISRIQFKLSVPESMINKIYVGQTATVTVNAAETTVEASVSTLSPSASAQTGGYTVVLEIDNTNSLIKPGMVGSVSFLMNQAVETVTLPLETVITEDDATFVYIEKDGTVTKTPVAIGMRDSETAEILEGVAVGDRIVSRGQHTVSDGVKVRVVKEH